MEKPESSLVGEYNVESVSEKSVASTEPVDLQVIFSQGLSSQEPTFVSDGGVVPRLCATARLVDHQGSDYVCQ